MSIFRTRSPPSRILGTFGALFCMLVFFGTFGALFMSNFTKNLDEKCPKTFWFGQNSPFFTQNYNIFGAQKCSLKMPLMENAQIKAAFFSWELPLPYQRLVWTYTMTRYVNGVGPIDDKPSPDKLWVWGRQGGGVNILSECQVSNSPALGERLFWRY